MKTINILASSFPPEVSGGSNRVFSIAKMFENNQYKVNIITLGEQTSTSDVSENMKVYRLEKKDIHNMGFIKRALSEIVDAYRLTKMVKKLNQETTIVSIPYMFILPIYALFGHGKYSIIDIRDVVWEYLPNKGVYKYIKKIISLVMYQSIKAFKGVTVTNIYEKNLIEEHIARRDIVVINNGIDQEKFNLFSNLSSTSTTNKQSVITYIGCIGLAQNLITLIKAIEKLDDKSILVNMVGTGNKKEELERYCQENQINNIVFHGQKPWKELEDIYAQTTILYAQLTKDYDSAIPSKLYEYAATGLPIIYGGVGESQTFMRQLENAMGIEPDNIEKLTDTIKIFQKKDLKKSTKNQLLIQEKFVRDHVNLKFLDVIK